MESRTTVFLTYPFLIVFDFLDIRVYGRNEIVNEDTLSGSRDFVRAVQEVIHECVRSVIVQNLNFSLMLETVDREFHSIAVGRISDRSDGVQVDSPGHHHRRIVSEDFQNITGHLKGH
jgi:hypothetical protein